MQALIVDVIVIVAAAYATWRLLPAALRRRGAAALGRALRRRGVAQHRVARIERRAAASACGACDSCGGCAPPAARDVDARAIAMRRVE